MLNNHDRLIKEIAKVLDLFQDSAYKLEIKSREYDKPFINGL